jgi:hypothetical protein
MVNQGDGRPAAGAGICADFERLSSFTSCNRMAYSIYIYTYPSLRAHRRKARPERLVRYSPHRRGLKRARDVLQAATSGGRTACPRQC